MRFNRFRNLLPSAFAKPAALNTGLVILFVGLSCARLGAVEAGPRMLDLPAGSQTLPSGGTVTIAPFRLASHELTWGEWASVRAWALRQGYVFGPGKAQGPAYPVSAVTWYDAVVFCNAASELAGKKPVYHSGGAACRRSGAELNAVEVDPQADGYRLPNEWEWEFACKAGTSSPFYWGEKFNGDFAWANGPTTRGDAVSPQPVGAKKPNAWGLFDMSGNVAEWTGSLFQPETQWRVQRGGSVALDNDLRSGFRSPVPPGFRAYDVGLRLASSSPSCPDLLAVVKTLGLAPPETGELLQPAYDYLDEAAVAKSLVALLDPNSKGAAPILAAQQAGKTQAALEIFRDQFLQRLKPLAPMHRPPKAPATEADITTWFAQTERYAALAKTEFDNLDNSGRAKPNSYTMPLTWDFGMGFSPSHEQWFDILRQLAAKHPDGTRFDHMPARAIATMAIYAATDDIAKTLKDPRDCVGNQQVDVARTLVLLARKLPEFREAAAWERLGIERIRTGALARFILPDGGDLEQSFNYNMGLFDIEHSLNGLFDGQKRPEWLEKLRVSVVDRARMLATLRHASGTWPSVGNNSYGRDLPSASRHAVVPIPYDDALTGSVINALLKRGSADSKPPAFTSVAFPYSGYYIMRSGWEKDASTLFFKSSRPGAGHNHCDNNGIELCAYGRHLLVGRESPPYQVMHLPAAQKKDLDWILYYKGEESPWVANTLLIEGCGQHPGTNANAYTTPIPRQTWHTSADFDVVQGSWTRTFSNHPGPDIANLKTLAQEHGGEAEELSRSIAAAEALKRVPLHTFDATHTRQVFYLRRLNVWIVTDRAERADHQPIQTLTQLWRLPGAFYSKTHPLWPGFTAAQVTSDATQGRVLTQNPANVNLALLHAVPGELKYQTHYGEKYPYRGWANLIPSMVSGYGPAVDLDVTTSGGGPLLTVLVPIPQGQQFTQRVAAFNRSFEGGQTTLTLTLADGTVVECRAGEQTVLRMTQAGTTQGLTLMRDGTGKTFTERGGERLNEADLTVPTAFSWQKTDSGMVPAYH